MVRCAIWYYSYNLKNVKNTHGRVLLLVLKVTFLYGCFSRFLNCTNGIKSRNAPHMSNGYSFSSGGFSSRKHSLDNQQNFEIYSCIFNFSCQNIIVYLLVFINCRDSIDTVDINIFFALFNMDFPWYEELF